MANVGKTHVKNTRLILDEFNLSGDSRQVGSFGVTFDTNDLTGYSDGVHYFQLGHANHILSGYQAVLSDTATTGVHEVLGAAAREDYIASYCIGVRAAPEIGSSAWLSTMEQVSYNTQGGSGGVLIDVEFEKSRIDADHINPWGFVLENGTSRSVSADLDGVDNIVATTNGRVAHLHIVAETGATTWTIEIEDSDDDAAGDPYANVVTFVSTGGALASERIDHAGAIKRWLRVKLTRAVAVGTVTCWITVARGLDL